MDNQGPFVAALREFTAEAIKAYPGAHASDEGVADYGNKMQKVAGVEDGNDLVEAALRMATALGEDMEMTVPQLTIYALLVGYVAGKGHLAVQPEEVL